MQSHLSATTVLDDGYDSDAPQNHNAAIESERPQEIDEPELGEALDTSSPACLVFRLSMLVGLMQSYVWSCMLAKLQKNGLHIISVTYLSVTCVHPSRMTQLHVTHSATCSIVWFHQDSPTRCPVGVPGMVDQP